VRAEVTELDSSCARRHSVTIQACHRGSEYAEKMELPRSLLPLGMKAVDLYEKIRRYIAVVFFPLVKFYVDMVMANYGLKTVDGPPKKSCQLGSITEKRELYIRLMENGHYGLAECIVDKYVEVQSFSDMIFNLLRRGFGVELFDGYTWLAGAFNLQKGDMAWDIASHYDTGKGLDLAMSVSRRVVSFY